MKNSALPKIQTFFLFFSFVVGVLNFFDTFFGFMLGLESYPLGVYLKPIFFVAQVVSLILFIGSVRFARSPVVSEASLSRFLSVHVILTAAIVLLYVDFQIAEIVRLSSANAFLELAFNLVYLVALSGTCFWFAKKLQKYGEWRWLSVAFVFLGLAFLAAFLEPMFFWSQNYVNLVFPAQLSFASVYAPLVLMFLAAMSTVTVLFWKTSFSDVPLSSRVLLLLFVPAFVLPLLWNNYKDGLINFVIRDVFYVTLGYSSFEWYSVSFYLMSIVAYVLVLREIRRRSNGSLAYALVFWGAVSLPWNGVTLLNVGYSSVAGNVLSLGSTITGISLLKGVGGVN